jgi:predicted RNase H-like nuclease
MKYIGVDGCKIGWFYTVIDHENQWEIGVSENIEKLWETHKDAFLILIDIPIGLPFKNPRACDLEARKLLGKGKTSTVFPPPCRESLAAKNHEEACEINKKVLGKKISLQTYHISKKIKEVDDFLLPNPQAKQKIRETHPEICFWALDGGSAMRFPKKKKQGFTERLELLKKVFPPAESIVEDALQEFKRKEVRKDDVLDSLAAAIVASYPSNTPATTSDTPEKDAMGLPMEMVYSNHFLTLKKQNYFMIDRFSNLLKQCDSSERVFPATELFNEGWLLRIILDWFSGQRNLRHPLAFTKKCRWFSEGLIPSQFLARFRGDPLAESWTHADGLIGNIEIGKIGKAGIQISSEPTHLTVLEAKLFSKLSPGVSNARYFDQAARYAACITEVLYRAERSPESFKRLGFYVLAPDEQIRAGVFKSKIQRSSILDKVKRRVEAYEGEKGKWFQRWFLPALDRLDIRCISWEEVLDYIKHKDPDTFNEFLDFYNKCLEYNRPAGLPGHP